MVTTTAGKPEGDASERPSVKNPAERSSSNTWSRSAPRSAASASATRRGSTATRASHRIGDAGTHPLVHQDMCKGGLDVVGCEGRHSGKIPRWAKNAAWPEITV